MPRKVPAELTLHCQPNALTIEAAEGDGGLPRFSMVAYTGSAMNVNGWDAPVVVDLAGLSKGKMPKPILLDHDRTQRVAHAEEITINGAEMKAAGPVSGVSAAAQEVIQSSRNGFPWQASMGLSVGRAVFVKAGNSVVVNGQEHVGPLYVARKSMLNEISFVPMGADSHTSAKVAAAATQPSVEVTDMKFEEWLTGKGFDAAAITDQQKSSLQAAYDAEQKPAVPAPAAVQAAAPSVDAAVQAMREAAAIEQTRIAEVTAAAGSHPKILAQAIKEGWDANKTELTVLRAERATPPAIHTRGGEQVTPRLLEAAVAITGNLPSLEASYDEKTLDAAHSQFRRGISLQQLIMECAWAGGYQGRMFEASEMMPILNAAFSTLSLPGIMSNNANKFLLEGYNHVESVWRSISKTRSVKDFKTVTSYRMTGAFQFEKVAKGGELKHGNVTEGSFTNRAYTHGKMFQVTREDIINDDLGALTDIPFQMGRGAGLQVNNVFWTEFLDNSTFFATGNNNYTSGGTTNLQTSSLKTVLQKFRDMTDPDGKPMAIEPKILLVPTALEVTALELMQSTNYNTGGSSTTEKVPNRNIWAGKFSPIVSAYLGNTSYTGASSLAWYLLADPMDIPVIEVCFLNGVQAPTIESSDAEFNTLGVAMRGYFDFGVAKQDYRGGQKSKGEA